MRNDLLVSVIVVTYNSSRYVLETLESVRDQTYKSVELIISDDGSTDNTVELCSAWLKTNGDRFSRVELISVEKNTGIPSNCNRGVNAARGKWLKLIAGDDALTPTCIEDNVAFVLKNKKINVLQTNLNTYRNEFIDNMLVGTSSLEESPFFREGITAREQYKMLVIKNRIKAPSIFIKKEVVEKVNGFDEDIPLMEDWPFWTKVTSKGFQIHFNAISTVKYRKHVGSVIVNGGKIINVKYAQNLLMFSKKYKKGNVPIIHYMLFNTGLQLIIFINQKDLLSYDYFNLVSLWYRSILKFMVKI